MAIAVYHDDDARREESTFEVMPKAFELAAKLAATEFVPVPLRNKPAAIAAAILQGHELGLPPMASLQLIHVIEGRPTVAAAGQRALILAKGHEIWIDEANSTRATVCGRRRGEDRVLSMTWTLDDAKRALLLGKPNWQRYPKAMLVARATGEVGRGAFMDVLAGIPYNQEELEDGDVVVVDSPPGGGGEAPAKSEPPARRRQARSAATAAAVLEPPTPPPGPEPEPIEDSIPLAVGTEPLPTPPEEEEDGIPSSPAVPPTEPAPEAAAGQAEVAATPTPEQPSSSPGEILSGPVEGAYWSDPQTKIVYKFTNGGWHAQTGPLAGQHSEPPTPTEPAAPPAELSIAQQVAIACREAGIDRAALIQAVTGKTSARELTRREAEEVRDVARKIGRGEARLELRSDTWVVLAT